MYTYKGTPLTRPPTGLHSIGRVSWGGRVTLAFQKISGIISITSFLEFFP